jgi:hypothetical protein
MEDLLHADADKRRQNDEQDVQRYEQALREWKKKPKTTEQPIKPTRPIEKRLTVNDTTVEAVAPILQENPRGVILIRDELTAWVESMNCYRQGGRGADRQFYLSCWSGTTYTADRRGRHEQGPLRVRHAFLPVIGGLTPERLPAIRGDMGKRKAEDDGWVDRVLFSYAEPMPVASENWMEVDPEVAEA